MYTHIGNNYCIIVHVLLILSNLGTSWAFVLYRNTFSRYVLGSPLIGDFRGPGGTDSPVEK